MAAPLLAGAPVAVEEAVPPWREQLTVRGIVVSAILGVLFCLITHKLNLTVGIIPSLNVAAGLLGYFLVRTWTAALARFGIVSKPFTKQENTVIQTCVVACYGLAFSGKCRFRFQGLELNFGVCLFRWRRCDSGVRCRVTFWFDPYT